METMQHSTEYSEEYVKADELSYNLLWLRELDIIELELALLNVNWHY